MNTSFAENVSTDFGLMKGSIFYNVIVMHNSFIQTIVVI